LREVCNHFYKTKEFDAVMDIVFGHFYSSCKMDIPIHRIEAILYFWDCFYYLYDKIPLIKKGEEYSILLLIELQSI